MHQLWATLSSTTPFLQESTGTCFVDENRRKNRKKILLFNLKCAVCEVCFYFLNFYKVQDEIQSRASFCLFFVFLIIFLFLDRRGSVLLVESEFLFFFILLKQNFKNFNASQNNYVQPQAHENYKLKIKRNKQLISSSYKVRKHRRTDELINQWIATHWLGSTVQETGNILKALSNHCHCCLFTLYYF